MDDIVDHDFFDDPNEDKYRSKASHENQKSFLSKLESSSSDDESSDKSHNNLHGTNGTHDGKGKSNAALKDTPSYKSPFYENDFESSDEDQFSDNEAHTEINQISVQVKRKQRNDHLVKNKNEPNDQLNDDSSDSVTDVSPLSSPEMSPNMNRKVVKTKTGKHHKQAFLKDLDYSTVQHIPKFNVSFETTMDMPSRRAPIIKDRNRNNVQNIYNDYFSSSDEDVQQNKMHGKAGQDNRHSRAVENHRQRLLGSTAMESRDISQLLETVLGFEQKAKQRRCAEEHERIVRPVSQQSERRKNLSFSNQQVREIDRENRRLLNEITRSRKQPRPSSASSVRSTTSVRSDATDRSRRSTSSRASSTSTQRHKSSKQTKLYHSTINRINYQRQVERENLKMLKRLQGCKPTPGLQRTSQLHEYKRQKAYMGTSIDRNGMSVRKAQELTKNSDVVKEVLGKSSGRYSVKPAWQEKW